ncbi:MAG: Crp/Fnr family transcriptional regulator [Cytophagales bacterium]|jgi:CRP/FNR family transcriptional regulator|nr:Crp/Fnr family transcriptional regulator [Cytophagales bacterium]
MESNLLNGLFEPELLAEIERNAKLVSIKADDALLDIGQAIKAVPIVVSGCLKVSRMDEDGRELLLYYITPNESCAMTFTCCLERHASEIKAVAEEDTTLLAVPVTVMDEWLVKFPSWKNFVMRTVRERFQELLKTIDQIAFQKLDERLVQYLKDKSAATGTALIHLSHEQIANELATSRVVVSRLLKKLENENKLLLYRHQIKLLRGLLDA